MRLGGVDFPRGLTEALERGDLVVFAGAGVSMGPPANLPNFEGLAAAIALGTGEAQQESEPVDRFLGRLASNGTNVHERAADTLHGGSPAPTSLHGDLLRLYRTPQSVRVVTTNFDALFEQAAVQVFDTAPSVFTAPALPLGSGFSGIVHVHGDLADPLGMVLTDADFGRAYLTEGWARRFLVDLFRTHTVLFVGYSHSDTVMNYLSRALPPDARDRFALTDEPDSAKWQLLGVEPIGYPKPAEGDHSALAKSVRRFADYRQRGLLDWQRDIAEIAKNPPPLHDEAMDLIGEALSDPERCRFFTNAASHVDWIAWLERRGHLDALFGTADLTGGDRQLAWWLAKRFARDHPSSLFLLIGRNHLRVHPAFWWELARVVHDEDHPLSAALLARWVSLLLSSASRKPDASLLLFLGARCAEAGLTDSLLDVFDVMAAGGLAIEPGFVLASEDDDGPPVSTQTERQHDPMLQFSLERLHEDHLKPNLQEVAESLLERVVRHLAERHRTLRSWQQATRDSDAMSFNRSAIEPHEQDQDRPPESVDVLIDAARDALEHLVATRPDAGARWCDRLVEAEAPLLRRLAVHALPSRTDLGADEQIGWLLSSIGLHHTATHHETFLAVRACYPAASARQRQATIDAIREYEWPRRDDDWEQYTAYIHFEWFHWLSDSAPDCDLAREALAGIQGRYTDFRLSKHPDLTHYESTRWGGDYDGPESPWSVEELLSRPAAERLEELLSFPDNGPFEPGRDGLLLSVGEAAGRDFEWGLALADALAGLGAWDSDLWTTLLRSWSGELDEDKHRRALARLGDVDLHRNQVKAIAAMLLSLVKDGGLPYASALLEQSHHLARRLWEHCVQDDLELGPGGWLTAAINRPAGSITQYWIWSLSLWRNRHDPRPEAMHDEHSSALLQVVNETAVAGRLGRTVLARFLGFLLAADEAWTREHLVPRFEDAHGDDYQAVWDGLLYGRMDRNVITALEDAIFATIPHMSDLFRSQMRHRRAFIELCTAVVTYAVDDPLEAWIAEFFKAADDSDKRFFAGSLGKRIREVDDARQRELWDRWLKRYWGNRLQGVPVPLTGGELAVMVNWPGYFESLFPEAVDLAVRMPRAPLDRWPVLHEINEGDQWSSYPEATVRLLIYVAEHDESGAFWHEGQHLVEKLSGLDLSEGAATQLDELRAKHGPS
ncbi:MAG: DUF4020 domain-containing protein [Gammaproteobacteria bacterium]|nr:DUF4020 domain-containing protein [Dehalococcoidia bacterium]MYJ74442.1 DUF4020 domain-containing protein [Gammaproteobacteria bacterium]